MDWDSDLAGGNGGWGGGLYAISSDITIANCSVSGNRAGSGGDAGDPPDASVDGGDGELLEIIPERFSLQLAPGVEGDVALSLETLLPVPISFSMADKNEF